MEEKVFENEKLEKFETEELDPIIKRSVEYLLKNIPPRQALESEEVLVTMWTAWYRGKILQALKECISDRFESMELEE